MQSSTSQFINALRYGSTLVAAQLTVYRNAVPTSVILPVSSANFTADRNSEFRRSGQITLEILPTVPPQTVLVNGVSYGLLPLNPSALLAPFGNEVNIQMSVIQATAANNANGTATAGANGWVPMGRYQIATAVVQDTGVDLTMTLNVYDRSWAIAQRQLLAAYSVPAAQGDLQSELQALMLTAWGGPVPWTYNITPNPGYTVPAGAYNQGQDPWQAAQDFFSSAGYELYFDVNGNIVGKPIPNPATSSVVWNFVEGELGATGTLAHPLGGTPYTTPVDVSMTLTRDGIPNNFVVGVSGPNNATVATQLIQANAADTNPNSPTYINGPMGNVPNFIFDSLITTQAQAQAEANFDLAQSLAKSWVVAVDTPPNPLFDIDDVCTVSRARLGLSNQKFVVDTISTSVRYDSLTSVGGRVIP